jgi:hypothetical protein
MELLAFIIISIAAIALFLWFSLHFLKLFFWVFAQMLGVFARVLPMLWYNVWGPLLPIFEVIGERLSSTENQRIKDLKSWALGQGFSFERATDHGITERFSDLKSLAQGPKQYATDLLEGVWEGFEFLSLDYHYQTVVPTPDGRRRVDLHHFSAVVMKSDVPLKPLLICPTGFGSLAPALEGYVEIPVEHTEFAREFVIRGPDRSGVDEVFQAEMVEFLLNSPRYVVEVGKKHMVAYRSGFFEEMHVEAAVDLLSGILARLPGRAKRVGLFSFMNPSAPSKEKE